MAAGYVSEKSGENYTVKKADAPITSGVISTKNDGPVAVVELETSAKLQVNATTVATALAEDVKIEAKSATSTDSTITDEATKDGVSSVTAIEITIKKGLEGNGEAVSELNSVLEFVFDISDTDMTRSNAYVYRMHNNTADKFAPKSKGTAGDDGTFYVDGSELHIFASKYSIYAYGAGTTYAAPTDPSSSSSGGGSYAPSGHEFITTLEKINKVSVGGKVLDSKYYTVIGTNVIISQEYIDTLSDGSYTVVIENATHRATGTLKVSGNKSVTSAKTFDAGIAVYGAMALMSAAGAVYVGKKR